MVQQGKKLVAVNPSQVPKLAKKLAEQLAKPMLSTSKGKPFNPQQIQIPTSGVNTNPGPKSFWGKIQDIIAVIGQIGG